MKLNWKDNKIVPKTNKISTEDFKKILRDLKENEAIKICQKCLDPVFSSLDKTQPVIELRDTHIIGFRQKLKAIKKKNNFVNLTISFDTCKEASKKLLSYQFKEITKLLEATKSFEGEVFFKLKKQQHEIIKLILDFNNDNHQDLKMVVEIDSPETFIPITDKNLTYRLQFSEMKRPTVKLINSLKGQNYLLNWLPPYYNVNGADYIIDKDNLNKNFKWKIEYNKTEYTLLLDSFDRANLLKFMEALFKRDKISTSIFKRHFIIEDNRIKFNTSTKYQNLNEPIQNLEVINILKGDFHVNKNELLSEGENNAFPKIFNITKGSL